MYEDFFSRRGVAVEDYEVFGLTSDASLADVSERYRALAKKVHPDSEDGNAFLFRAIVLAYGRICTAHKDGTPTPDPRSVGPHAPVKTAGAGTARPSAPTGARVTGPGPGPAPGPGPGPGPERHAGRGPDTLADRDAARASDRPKDRAAARAAGASVGRASRRPASPTTERPPRRPPARPAVGGIQRAAATPTGPKGPRGPTSPTGPEDRAQDRTGTRASRRQQDHAKRRRGLTRTLLVAAGVTVAVALSFGIGAYAGVKQQSGQTADPTARTSASTAVPVQDNGPGSVPPLPFNAQLTGIRLTTSADASGGSTVTMTMRLGIPQGTLLTLSFGASPPAVRPGTRSLGTVRLGSYQGVVTAETGTAVSARITTPQPMYLTIVLGVDPSTGALTGTVTGTDRPV